MPEQSTQLYEGMFLFNPSAINASVSTAAQTVRELLDRAGAQVEALYKWDDRRMAYEIEGQKRGLYMLAYFRVRGVQIANIERDVNLSEQVMRCLILRAEHVGDAELELARQKQSETLDAAALEGGKEAKERAAGAPEPAAKAEAAQPAEGANRSEPMAAAGVGERSARPTPEAGGGEGGAPESGDRS